jgi:hypothetical protein
VVEPAFVPGWPMSHALRATFAPIESSLLAALVRPDDRSSST